MNDGEIRKPRDSATYLVLVLFLTKAAIAWSAPDLAFVRGPVAFVEHRQWRRGIFGLDGQMLAVETAAAG